jgi:hypothetical protein
LDSAALLKGKSKGKNALALSDGEGSDEEFEAGPSAVPKAFKQRDLVAQAFAGDNVIEVGLMPIGRANADAGYAGLCRGKAESDGSRCAEGRGYHARWMGEYGPCVLEQS